MKNIILSPVGIGLFLMAFAGAVSAHDQKGALGIDASATDIYLVTCGNIDIQTDKLDFKILNKTKDSPPVSAQVVNLDLAMSTTDLNINKDKDFSPLLEVEKQGTNLIYTIIVDKSAVGQLAYQFEYHCLDNSGQHADTDIQRIQNEFPGNL